MLPAWLFFTSLLQAILLLLVAPLISGMSRVLRAKFHSRHGPGLLQDYYDLQKLLGRQEIVPAQAGLIFLVTPYVFLAAMLLVAMVIPAIMIQPPIAEISDIIVVIYLFALARFFLTLSGIDSGNMFAGIGASRETTLAVLNEPIMMLSLFVVALLAHSTKLGTIAAALFTPQVPSYAATIMAMIAFAFAIFIEMGKLPFDLAEAEQELQGGPLTEYSGRSLALMKWGISLRQTVAAALLIGVFVPFGAAFSLAPLPILLGIIILVAKLLAVFLALGFLENTMARIRILDSARFTYVAAGAAMLAFAFSLAGI